MGHSDTSPARRSAGRTAWLVLVWVVGILFAAVLLLNLVGRLAFDNFYDNAKGELDIPGTDTGFVVQDQVELPDGSWLFSGYDGSGLDSPLYRVAADGVARLTVSRPDGSTYDGHGGGVTCDDEFVYLTDQNGYLVLPLGAVESALSGQQVPATAQRQLGIDPAFLTIIDGRLYAGVFYKAGPYDTPAQMHLTAPDGTQNHAVMYAYEPGLADGQPGNYGEQPAQVYSIPDQAQGVAVVDGLMVFSQSWGLSPSTLPAYELSKLQTDGTYSVGEKDVPLTFLDGRSLVGTVTAPPMSEGLVTKDGRVWLSTEAASNKYFFGKLFGAWRVMALDVQGALGL